MLSPQMINHARDKHDNDLISCLSVSCAYLFNWASGCRLLSVGARRTKKSVADPCIPHLGFCTQAQAQAQGPCNLLCPLFSLSRAAAQPNALFRGPKPSYLTYGVPNVICVCFLDLELSYVCSYSLQARSLDSVARFAASMVARVKGSVYIYVGSRKSSRDT